VPAPDSVQRYRAAFAQRDLVSEVEALRARAWPPLTILDLDGWQLRSAGGLTRRANSAWPRAAGPRLPLEARIAQMEAFYLQGTTDPLVQLLPGAAPAGLAAALRARGYLASPPVEVRTRRADLLVDLAAPDDVVLTDDLDGWLQRWARATGADGRAADMAGRMLARVAPPQALAVLAAGSEVAVARGVLDGGWLGLDLLAASPGLAHQGAGHALLAALGRWGARGGAQRAHLEADPADPVAVALQTAAGFRRAYTFTYLAQPQALVPRAAHPRRATRWRR
jgi:N-acetylglutamate synthase